MRSESITAGGPRSKGKRRAKYLGAAYEHEKPVLQPLLGACHVLAPRYRGAVYADLLADLPGRQQVILENRQLVPDQLSHWLGVGRFPFMPEVVHVVHVVPDHGGHVLTIERLLVRALEAVDLLL